MLPYQLNAASFSSYPVGARALAVAHLSLFRQLPLAFLPGLLQEVAQYDYGFPAERNKLDAQLAALTSLKPEQLQILFAPFSALQVTPELAEVNWCAQPSVFGERFAAYLWSTQQMDAYRAAAHGYGAQLEAKQETKEPAMRRLGIAAIGQGASADPQTRLFHKLREHGTLFNCVQANTGAQELVSFVEQRARQQPLPYAHWYVDGGAALPHSAGVTSISYAALEPARAALLALINKQASKPGMGPETLRDTLVHLAPTALGLEDNSVLDRFRVKLLTEGSGTQIFSTTFAQWTGREVLRRAEALTLLVRFAPRQRQRPMYELLAPASSAPEADPQGSLIDGDIAAYYQWISQQRLPGFRESSFLAWFEGQQQAVAIGPSLPRDTVSNSPVQLRFLLTLLTT